jgi:hypothetical protein
VPGLGLGPRLRLGGRWPPLDGFPQTCEVDLRQGIAQGPKHHCHQEPPPLEAAAPHEQTLTRPALVELPQLAMPHDDSG